MKSYCYVVLPMDLSPDKDSVNAFVKNQIYKYYSELEVEPYKRFFTEKETREIAQKKGFNDIDIFKEYLYDNLAYVSEIPTLYNSLHTWGFLSIRFI
jgi:hypothetical protein